MSLADLTRNSFQSGVSATKWTSLCRLFISKSLGSSSRDDIEHQLSNSVLILYRSYPGDPDLQEYLKCAMREELLSSAIFVATFLQAARSPELHSAATLDMLCRAALESHYSSGLSASGSVTSLSESPMTTLATVGDALALLRIAHSLQTSDSRQLIVSASELIILLLSCIGDMSQISTAQAMVHFADANNILQNFQLSSDVRQVLETFVLSLSFIIGDDAKAAREAQMMHSIQLAFGKGDTLEPSSNTDIISIGLVLQYLVQCRGREFGAGSGNDPVAFLLAISRWTSWSPQVYFTQLLLSAITSLSQCSAGSAWIWKSFIVGRLPSLIASFEGIVKSDGATNTDWRSALQIAVSNVLGRSDLLARCDAIVARSLGVNSMQENAHQSVFREFLQQLLMIALVDQTFALSIDATILDPGIAHRIRSDAQDVGCDLEAYSEARLTPDTSFEDMQTFVTRVWRDPSSHAAFSCALIKRITTVTSTLDLEPMSHLCKFLYTYDIPLDIASLHIRISDIVFQALLFLELYDCETVGDPQTAVGYLGDVVLFVQSTLARFHLGSDVFSHGDRSISSRYIKTVSFVHPVEELHGEDSVAFTSWFKALFDSNSEGIEDTILRSTKPKTLLRIAATLFSHAISSSSKSSIDSDVLHNGVAYFLGPLLNWTLVGVVRALLQEITSKGFNAPMHFQILQTLLLSPSCPRPVQCLCAPDLLSLLSDKRVSYIKLNNTQSTFDAPALRQVAASAIGLSGTGSHVSQPINTPMAWQDQPRQAIQNALTVARGGKVPSLAVEICLFITTPTEFLRMFWLELVNAASVGEMEACRRIATFVLTMPRPPHTAPLLPLFLHIFIPSLLMAVDGQPPAEQSVNIELLVSIINSSLTGALHLEWALRTASGTQRYVLGENSATLARRLAATLRMKKNQSHAVSTIAQRLAASHSFTANFPMFVGELGI